MAEPTEGADQERRFYHDFWYIHDAHFSDADSAELFTKHMLQNINPRQLRAFRDTMAVQYPGHENIILEGLLIYLAGCKRREEINQLQKMLPSTIDQPNDDSVFIRELDKEIPIDTLAAYQELEFEIQDDIA